jgi:hypothetical protein
MFYLKPPRHISTLPISTELGCPGHVRFTPGSDRIADITERQVRANNGSRQFSITSFAWGEQFAGTLRQIALRNQYMHADEIKIVNIST